MKREKVEYTVEEKEQLQSELKKQQTPHVYRRLVALKLKAVDRKSSREVSQIVGMNVSSINKLVVRFKAGGIEVIVTKRHDHGNRYMTREEEVAFLKGIREQAQSGQVIEVSGIHRAYEAAVGHPVTRSAIYYMLHKHGWRKIKPRGKHPKKASPEMIEDYKKNHEHSKISYGNISFSFPCDVSGRGWVWPDQQTQELLVSSGNSPHGTLPSYS
jgi:transposase